MTNKSILQEALHHGSRIGTLKSRMGSALVAEPTLHFMSRRRKYRLLPT